MTQLGPGTTIATLFLCAVQLLGPPEAQAGDQANAMRKLEPLVLRGIQLTVAHRYQEARACFDSLSTALPTHPAGPFLLAAMLHSQMLDYESDRGETEFYRLIQEGVARATRQLRADPNNSWALFYRGAAYGYRAFHAARQGRYLRAYRDGQLAMRDLQKAVATDSSLADAYLAIGSYKYWRAKVLRYLNWLPFVPEEREEAIRLIRLAIAKGRYSYLTGLSDLSWILIDAGRCEEAVACAQEGLTACPDSRFFLWPLAEAHFRRGDYFAAAEWYERLLASLLQVPDSNHYNEIICRLRLARAYCARGERKKVRYHTSAILGLSLDKQTRQRVEGKLAEVKAIVQRCRPLADPVETSR